MVCMKKGVKGFILTNILSIIGLVIGPRGSTIEILSSSLIMDYKVNRGDSTNKSMKRPLIIVTGVIIFW